MNDNRQWFVLMEAETFDEDFHTEGRIGPFREKEKAMLFAERARKQFHNDYPDRVAMGIAVRAIRPAKEWRSVVEEFNSEIANIFSPDDGWSASEPTEVSDENGESPE